MNEKVEAFLREKEQARREEETQSRNQRLLALGLYEMEFAPDNEMSPEYPLFQDGKFCRKVPVEVTDEEYAAICAADTPEKKDWPELPVDKILFVLAMVVYFTGLIVGISFGSGQYYESFSLLTASTVLIYAVLIGSLFLGLSELLKLLKKIADKET